MNRIIHLTIILLLGISSLSAQNHKITLRSTDNAECIQNDFHSMKANFSFSSIESVDVETEKGTFSEISIPNTYPSANLGEPALPTIHELLAIPFGAEPQVVIKNFTIDEYDLDDYGIKRLMPKQMSLRKDQNPEDVEFAYNEAAYQTKSFADSPSASIEVTGTMRGIRIGSLIINPVSYNASENKIRVFNNIEVEVVFSNADVEETERMLISTASPYFSIVYNQMFNSRAINDVYDDHPDLWSSPVRMIVIANDMFEDALEPWIQWKTEKGFYLDINYTSEIGTTSSDIKTFLQNKYNEGVQNNETPTFVVIVGDRSQVAESSMGSSTQRVTDLYYGSVDGDYYPDMFYSRMSAETTTDLTNIINKILQYEQYTMPDPSYLNNVLLIAGADSYWNPRVGVPTINYATTYYYNGDHGFNSVYCYLTQYSGCYNNLNTGVGFANYTAHGSETSWSSPYFSNSHVNNLTNTDKYFLAMGNCCVTGNWGYSSSMCFGEAMIRANNKGAYTYIGSCPNTYWYEDYYFGVGATNTHNGPTPSNTESSTGVYDAVWMDDTYNTVSSMVFIGNLAVCYAHAGNYDTHSNPTYYWQAYHVIGDGSIMPYRVEPSQNNVSHEPSIEANASIFHVEANAGSYVALSQGSTLLGAALVGDNGSVDVPITPVSSGEVKLVVTAPQHQPYTSNLTVGSGGGTPMIVFESCTPNIINVISNINLNITMKNNGSAATTSNTTVTITCDDPYIEIVEGTATYGPMAPNATASSTFIIKADATTPHEHVFEFDVAATNNGTTWNSTFSITVNNDCNLPTNFTAEAIDQNSIELSWNASPTALSYNIYRGGVLITNVTGTSYIDTGLEPETQYCYNIRSMCNTGESGNYAQDCATTLEEPEPCLPPTNLDATVEQDVPGYQYKFKVTLTWNTVSGAESYTVYANDTFLGYSTTNMYIAGSNNEGTVVFTVETNCEDGVSEMSEPLTVVIEEEEEPCLPPTNLNAVVQQDLPDFEYLYKVTLTWDTIENADSYYVYINGDSTVEVSEPSYVYGTDEEGTLEFIVSTICGDTGSEFSDPITVIVQNDAISEYENLFDIYPNPVDNHLIIKTQENIEEISIYNIVGLCVYHEISNISEIIDMSSLSSGTYFVEIKTDKGEIIKRIIKK